MHDAGAGLQRAEEICRMIRRIAEEQRDRGVLAIAGAEEGGSCDLDHGLQLAVTDRPLAEFDRRPRTELGRRFREQVRQRTARDRIVPVEACGIKLFAGMGHESSTTREANTSGRAPLPLAGRGW